MLKCHINHTRRILIECMYSINTHDDPNVYIPQSHFIIYVAPVLICVDFCWLGWGWSNFQTIVTLALAYSFLISKCEGIFNVHNVHRDPSSFFGPWSRRLHVWYTTTRSRGSIPFCLLICKNPKRSTPRWIQSASASLK